VFLALVPAALALERQTARHHGCGPRSSDCGFHTGPSLVATLRDAADLHERGDGYANSAWTRDLIAMVRQMPQSVVIYSNAPEVIYYLTGREAREIPAPVNR
jgi:hypothetical protein